MGFVFGEVPGFVVGELPGLTLLGFVFGEVPGLTLLGLVFGAVVGLVFGEVPEFRLFGFVPAGVVIGVPAASLVIPFGLGVAGLAAFGLTVPESGLLVAAGTLLRPHKLTKSKVVPLVVSM